MRGLGFRVEGGFVELAREEVQQECLMNKLRELAVIADRMGRHE